MITAAIRMARPAAELSAPKKSTPRGPLEDDGPGPMADGETAILPT